MEEEIKQTSEDRIAALEQQIQALMTLFQTQNVVTTKGEDSAKSDTVKIVHLVERAPRCTTYIQLSNLVISMSRFGEERKLSVQQFEELIGKYRSWFNEGIIALAAGYEEYAERYGLKTAKNYPIKSDFIQSLGKVRMDELENVFPNLPEAGKNSIITYWNRKAREGDPNFKDIRKLETLNRLSGGQMTQLIGELNNQQRLNNK